MIEFKAECGHTVRAKDEDAGGSVRCTYCGCQAPVPDNQDENLDFLFNDLEPAGELPGGGRRRQRRFRKRLWSRRPRATGQFDVFAIILRMCYAALLIVIVIFVADRWVVPLFREGVQPATVTKKPRPQRGQDKAQPEKRRSPERRRGFIARDGGVGLYVASTPHGATIYTVKASEAGEGGRINEIPGCSEARTDGSYLRLPDGTYVVEVVLPWNYSKLSDARLPNYQAYRAFRRAIEYASDDERSHLLEDYFVPDKARTVFVDKTDEQIYLVRQYWDVQVRGGRSKGIRALFLPKIVPQGRSAFAIEPLITHYLPKEEMYSFDEVNVLNELDYYDVTMSDRSHIVDALKRIGVAPYITGDGRTRLFSIGIDDGAITAPLIRDAPQ